MKNVPLKLIIKALSGYEIELFNYSDERDLNLLEDLKHVATLAGETINKKGICRTRANEVGNGIEKFVKDALIDVGYKADTPKTITGKRESTGYPDIEFIDEYGRTHYIECKTYNVHTISTTQRSFYLSPSEDFMITSSRHHFVISYEIYQAWQVNNKKIFKCKNWKILSIDMLLCDIKYEFNSDNKRLYSQSLTLAEDIIE